ncbi:MAG: ABC transporter ATP-binding protein, partial [Telmatospirillum sp.]|nr:ABC transporter ATP-binding protein [Telmatospirillum sp.]
MTLLEVNSLTLSIGGRQILEDVSFRLEAGRILGLVGASGSGKSLTLASLLRLLPEGARMGGSVRLDGRDLAALTEPQLCAVRGRDIGMIFQEPLAALNPLMTIGRQVSETLRLHGARSRAGASRDADGVLAQVGLPAGLVPRDRFPHQLSGGQRQRVAIAQAIAMRPRLLIADEPTTALDVTTQSAILDLLAQLARRQGMALILVSHDLPAIATIADDVLVMEDGRIVERGPLARVFETPRQRATADLIETIRRHPAPHPAPAPDVPPVLEARSITHHYPAPRRWFRGGGGGGPAGGGGGRGGGAGGGGGGGG